MISPCGMFCSNCIRKRATSDEELKSLISGKKNIPIDSAPCNGCSSMNSDGVSENRDTGCSIYICSREKKIQYCYECETFPCDLINSGSGIINDELGYYKIINLKILEERGADILKSTLNRNKKYREYIPNCPCHH